LDFEFRPSYLVKQEDIRDASAMSAAIDRMSNKVMERIQGKLAPASECSCRYPNELSHVRKTYDDTLRQHPDWRDKAVSYMQGDKSHAISFNGLRLQLQTKCRQGQ
jgi:hypothetical protein